MQQHTNNVVVELGPAESGANECVTPQELYDHLNLNCGLNAIQEQLEGFITAARQQFEFGTDGRAVLPTTFEQHLTQWPQNAIRLERGAVLELTSVTYYDADDDEQELDTAAVDTASVPALVYLPEGSWPALSSKRPRPVVVEFVAGWGSVEAVPADVKLAVKLLAGHYYAQREAYGEVNLSEVPMGFQRVCDKYRTGTRGW